MTPPFSCKGSLSNHFPEIKTIYYFHLIRGTIRPAAKGIRLNDTETKACQLKPEPVLQRCSPPTSILLLISVSSMRWQTMGRSADQFCVCQTWNIRNISATTRQTVIKLKITDGTSAILIKLEGLVHFDTAFLKSWPHMEAIIEGHYFKSPWFLHAAVTNLI